MKLWWPCDSEATVKRFIKAKIILFYSRKMIYMNLSARQRFGSSASNRCLSQSGLTYAAAMFKEDIKKSVNVSVYRFFDLLLLHMILFPDNCSADKEDSRHIWGCEPCKYGSRAELANDGLCSEFFRYNFCKLLFCLLGFSRPKPVRLATGKHVYPRQKQEYQRHWPRSHLLICGRYREGFQFLRVCGT